MPIGILFWVIMVVTLLFGAWQWRTQPWAPFGLAIWALFFVIGWKLFGFVVQ